MLWGAVGFDFEDLMITYVEDWNMYLVAKLTVYLILLSRLISCFL